MQRSCFLPMEDGPEQAPPREHDRIQDEVMGARGGRIPPLMVANIQTPEERATHEVGHMPRVLWPSKAKLADSF